MEFQRGQENQPNVSQQEGPLTRADIILVESDGSDGMTTLYRFLNKEMLVVEKLPTVSSGNLPKTRSNDEGGPAYYVVGKDPIPTSNTCAIGSYELPHKLQHELQYPKGSRAAAFEEVFDPRQQGDGTARRVSLDIKSEEGACSVSDQPLTYNRYDRYTLITFGGKPCRLPKAIPLSMLEHRQQQILLILDIENADSSNSVSIES